jgi:4-amino-4-deoxy-L-arabinose transferase-like glycosyltransferase
MIWAQALSIKLLGFSEFSARLPAAVCGMLTVLLVIFFLRSLTADRWIWIMPAIILCTSMSFLREHTVRAGEYDAMLMLFCTAYLFSFFNYTENTGERRNKHLLLFFVFLTLGCLTKGIAALLFTPALFIYLLLRKQLLATLRNKYTYIGALGFVLFVLGYYLLRERINPGYLQAVSLYELGGRFNTPMQGEPVPWNFYLENIRMGQFSVWYWALPVSLVLMWLPGNNKLFRVMGFSWLCVAIYLAVISKSATKYAWYDLPVFPLLALIVSLVILQLSQILSALLQLNKQLITVAVIAVFSIQPTMEAYTFLHEQKDDLAKDNFYAPSYYLRQSVMGARNLNGFIYLSSGYFNIQWRLYINMLKDHGVYVQDDYSGGKFKPGDRLIAHHHDVKSDIEKNYDYVVLDEFYDVKSYLIKSRK